MHGDSEDSDSRRGVDSGHLGTQHPEPVAGSSASPLEGLLSVRAAVSSCEKLAVIPSLPNLAQGRCSKGAWEGTVTVGACLLLQTSSRWYLAKHSHVEW